jgi:hypothetical protein
MLFFMHTSRGLEVRGRNAAEELLEAHLNAI